MKGVAEASAWRLMNIAVGLALVMREANRADYGKHALGTSVSWKTPWGDLELTAWDTVAHAYDVITGFARGIALRFDARNGNNGVSYRIEMRMAAEAAGLASRSYGTVTSAVPVDRSRLRNQGALLKEVRELLTLSRGYGMEPVRQRAMSTAETVSASLSDVVDDSALELVVDLRLAFGRLLAALGANERAEKEHLRGPALKAAFEERLGGLGYPDTWLGGLASDRARAMIERLDAYLSDCDALGIRADVEQPVRADVDIPVRLLSPELRDRAGARIRAAGLDAVPVTISGRIDRLEHLGGYEQQDEDHPGGNNGVRVMDLKTGQRVPKDVQRHPQLAAYRLALASHGHHVLGGALVLLGKEPSKRSGDGYVLAPPGAALDPSPAALEPADRSGDEPSDGDVSTAAEVSEDYWAEDLVAGAAIAGSGFLLQARTGEHCRTCMVKDSWPVQVEGRRVVS